jgi:hypothetical protein
MRCETGTFELRDNDMMMRELTSAETNEVAGGTGTASVAASSSSGPGGLLIISGSLSLVTADFFASGAESLSIAAFGVNNTVTMSSTATVGAPF